MCNDNGQLYEVDVDENDKREKYINLLFELSELPQAFTVSLLCRAMYVTKLYSELTSKKCLEEVPDGPNLGFLLIKDVHYVTPKNCSQCGKQECEIQQKMLFNNMNTTLRKKGYGMPINQPIILIPVLNQPLSSYQFYPIHANGEFKGESFTWDSNYLSLNPQPLDPQNIYQQITISSKEGSWACGFAFMSFDDRILLLMHQCEIWMLYYEIAYNFSMSEARGINSTLRAHLPQELSKSVIVGKWYCPFMFVREGRIRDQVERAMYYEITLEQRWEQVFTCKSSSSNEDFRRSFEVETEQVFIGGVCKAKWDVACDGIIWFTKYGTSNCGHCERMGLRVEVVERMKYEQEMGGWKNYGTKGDFKVLVETDKKLFLEEPKKDWKEYSCYILVERFNFRRMDQSLAMAYDFSHTHQIRTIWE